jgi:hypothetical protein
MRPVEGILFFGRLLLKHGAASLSVSRLIGSLLPGLPRQEIPLRLRSGQALHFGRNDWCLECAT